ncbi:branched-chain amino acid aminotransferase [Mobilicoccus caccae]|uniref:Branched-chain-amino-acid aminotransferase n=1 Tax=Mobilicoccus caccae TaxID=1859295 RepID=A0ABQ6IR90_9MICO|nr:branched-chain amino acid aminotransferase [Mobilicoccus caccae]GMA40434.1 branched-chain-amino-acid aminotransferase [Mobilicoccus caccae]
MSKLTFSTSSRPDPLADEARLAILDDPGFGVTMTDHMVRIEWTREGGWSNGELLPYGPISIEPAAGVFHYGQEIFEGLKAFRHSDGSVWCFRPEVNGARLQRSAKRLALPELDIDDFIESLKVLVSADEKWVPEFGTGETSLYLRPFMIASEAFLGVRPANGVTYFVIASPAGAYFSGGIKPVSLWLSTDYARAGDGGTGAAKCGGNYASSLAGQVEAAEHGCEQVVFLDSSTHTYIEELGGMNLFLVYADGRLVTPELTGSILEGVTRSSILELATDLGLRPEERRIPIQEWKDGVASGEITEVFACGTAAVVTPVGTLKWDGGESTVGTEAGETTMKIRQSLLDIQYGKADDTRGWMTRLV